MLLTSLYTDTVQNQPPPPSYQEAIGRIRKQLPKLSRSISLTAQKLGRAMSVNRNAVLNNENSVTQQMTSENPSTNGGGAENDKRQKSKSYQKKRKLNQTMSMVESRTNQNIQTSDL
jgi:hypothetical protein